MFNLAFNVLKGCKVVTYDYILYILRENEQIKVQFCDRNDESVSWTDQSDLERNHSDESIHWKNKICSWMNMLGQILRE